MKPIALYPIEARKVESCCGQTVMAVTQHGDRYAGILHSVKDGFIYLQPMGAAANAKAKLSYFPGIGLAIALPLVFLAGLFAFPYFWI